MNEPLRLTLPALVLGFLASSASAQLTTDQSNPFNDFDRSQRNTAISGSVAAIPYKLPAAVPVRRPLKLMPRKPTLVLEGDAARDQELEEMGRRRHSVLAEIKRHRRTQNQREVTRLLRELEGLRQARLTRVRQIATRVAVKPATPEEVVVPETGEQAKPLLPIPTLPGKKDGK